MDTPDTTRPAPNAPPRPEHLRWEVSDVRTHSCTLATARATGDQIILSFGSEQGAGGAITAALAQQIALSPLTAKHLAEMAQRLLGEIDSAAPPR